MPKEGEMDSQQSHCHSERAFHLNDKGMDGDFDDDDCRESTQFVAHKDGRICVLVLAATNRVQE
jgi:hypothetical protein